jgi:hypothetical protein
VAVVVVEQPTKPLTLSSETDEVDVNTRLMLVDMLRRCARFEQAQAITQRLQASPDVQGNEYVRSVLSLQLELCRNRDTLAYTIEGRRSYTGMNHDAEMVRMATDRQRRQLPPSTIKR